MKVEIPYYPREHQLEVHLNLKRWNVLVCHRRFGKTVLCINQLIKDALKCELDNPRFAYIAPLYKQAKTIAWDYLKEFLKDIPNVKFNESELRADLPNGARITLYGADNPDALRGIYLDGVVLDEYAQMNPKTWVQVIRPALSDRKGYAIFIGTPEGHNAFYKLFTKALTSDEWYAKMFKASETGIVDQEELEMARIDMGEDEYKQEYECSFEASIKGSIYGDDISTARSQNRICKVPYDPRLPVICVNDVGDATWAIGFFQKVGREKRWIDSAELFMPSNEEFAEFLRDKPYKYDKIYLPFDSTVQRKELGMSTIQHLQQLGVHNLVPIPQQKSVYKGIKLVKKIFPDLWIDESMEHAIECISNYVFKKMDSTDDYQKVPYHNWASHTSDMLRYFAVICSEYEMSDERKRNNPKKKLPKSGWQGKMGRV